MDPLRPRKGRGAISNRDGRFESLTHEAEDDGWGILDDELAPLRTTLSVDTARSIITRNDSPDVGFEQSINPYRGCEHGCIYCFARPSHAYLGLSPGLDFETKLFYKPDAARLLAAELSKPSYRCKVIALGTNTDPYQPLERRLKVTRAVLETLAEYRQPVAIITKNALVQRDLDLLSEMAKERLAMVFVSITTLDRDIARELEPRASTPQKRLETLAALASAGVPCGVMTAPVIPALTDHELENILQAASQAGASTAGYVLLRLPREIAELFREWLAAHFPGRAKHVMSLLQEARGGKDYDSTWGTRMRGTGPYADLLAQRFSKTCKKLGLNEREFDLRMDLFKAPKQEDGQMDLFGG